jgi:hypothetical protein
MPNGMSSMIHKLKRLTIDELSMTDLGERHNIKLKKVKMLTFYFMKEKVMKNIKMGCHKRKQKKTSS